MSISLHTKYRPTKLSQVRGNKAVIASLTRTLEAKDSQAFLFCGPAGTGKTSLSRIASRILGCRSKDLLEIDGATYTGVDDMRRIKEVTQYRPFGASGHRAIIIDECHRISRNAWDSLLKAIEEPPPHVTWFFCTTDVSKVPETIRTRCSTFTLQPLPDDELSDLIDSVCKSEGISVPDTIRGLIVRQANGSPRQALVNLSLCRDVKDRSAAVELLKTAIDSDDSKALCQFLVRGGSWLKAMAIVEKLNGQNPEGLRILVVNYLGAALKNAKGDKEACHLLGVLENFSSPFNSAEGVAPLILAIGRSIFGGQ